MALQFVGYGAFWAVVCSSLVGCSFSLGERDFEVSSKLVVRHPENGVRVRCFVRHREVPCHRR